MLSHLPDEILLDGDHEGRFLVVELLGLADDEPGDAQLVPDEDGYGEDDECEQRGRHGRSFARDFRFPDFTQLSTSHTRARGIL